MRIAFIDEDLSLRTGSRRFTIEVARQLENKGHNVSLLTTRFDTTTCFQAYLSSHVEVFSRRKTTGKPATFSLPHRKRNFVLKTGNDLAHWSIQAGLVMRLSKRVADLDCDVAIVQYHGEHWLMPYFYHFGRTGGAVYLNVTPPMPPPLALPFQELPLHCKIVDRALDLPPIGCWEQTSLKRIVLFLAPSYYLLKQAERQGLISRRKAQVVPLGVNHSEFFPTEEEEPFALYLGRIHPHKSLELAIAAMRYTSPDESLVIAGDIDEQHLWYKDKLLRLAEKMRISDKLNIVLRPSESEVSRLMQRCSVFLFPSIIDTFGLVVLEAMACGKPVIACNRGGVPEIVGDAGFLLEPNVEQWQKAVSKLFSDSQLRKQLGKKASERSMVFSWENTAKRLLSTVRSFSRADDVDPD